MLLLDDISRSCNLFNNYKMSLASEQQTNRKEQQQAQTKQTHIFYYPDIKHDWLVYLSIDPSKSYLLTHK